MMLKMQKRIGVAAPERNCPNRDYTSTTVHASPVACHASATRSQHRETQNEQDDNAIAPGRGIRECHFAPPGTLARCFTAPPLEFATMHRRRKQVDCR